jgi:hypothetical protein
VKGEFPMPTQEKRIRTLEQRTATAIQEVEENTTIMLGVIPSQGQDIRKTLQRLEAIETTLNEHTTLLTQILALLQRTT